MATGDDHRKSIVAGDVWDNVKINEQRTDPGVDDRPGWKTVRIFVSSTFKDFHQEREVLIKEVSEIDWLFHLDCLLMTVQFTYF